MARVNDVGVTPTLHSCHHNFGHRGHDNVAGMGSIFNMEK
jgi:hypothetical protein